MAIVSESGRVTRTGKSAKSAKSKAAEPQPEAQATTSEAQSTAKRRKDKAPKAPTRCDLCGATDRPVRYHEGNACCEACAQKPQPDATAPKADAKSKRAPKAAEAATPASDVIVPRSLADLARSYEAQMQKDEKTPATIAGYVNDLGIALRELGAATLVADLTPKRVGEYFASDAVVLLRSGGKKSQLSVDKTRRVLRLALDHAVALGWIETAPIPA